MAKTIEFYEGVLGMPLVKTTEIPFPGGGQHFFFDCGNGDLLAFFWFGHGVPAAPGVAYPLSVGGTSADGSMHHVAFKISVASVDAWAARLKEKGVDYQFVAHRLPSVESDENRLARAAQLQDGTLAESSSADIDDDTFAASFYMKDPDEIQVELCAWLPAWDRVVKEHAPKTAADRPQPVGV
jgi:catechol 2,3-dioxygenase-like lactoylglutathione lyase family enzyme